ncbi:MAG TPA: glycine zipper 2TM domain-containing protein [Caulobacteraceae bacterium]|nr:glycine zipper 2TM domain-containing protein [Caulobacteraceae bacterium]
MRKILLVAGFAVAALVPSLAFAQQSCEQQRDHRALGTAAGAGIGALLGIAIAPRDDRAAGAVIGGASGAVIGNQVARADADCAHAYGYYDQHSQWHANAVDRVDARGYYDRDGGWVEGAPNGYYDAGGRWVVAQTAPSASGYYDGHGRWIPASAGGHYDDAGQWIASASGYYDDSGRWVPGEVTGAYDARGRWVTGARSGHVDANGVWVADAQPGYYDSSHRWRAGPARGYYDARGVWIAITPSAAAVGADASYQGGDRRDLDSRERWLEQRIRSAGANGTLSQYEASQDLRELGAIRRQETGMRNDDGGLSPRHEAELQARVDDLTTTVRRSLNGQGL